MLPQPSMRPPRAQSCNNPLALYRQPVPSSQLVVPVQFSLLESYGLLTTTSQLNTPSTIADKRMSETRN